METDDMHEPDQKPQAAPVDPGRLRDEVQLKYEEVAADPGRSYHFFTGRRAAEHVGYPAEVVDQVPEASLDAFAGVANPFHWGLPTSGEHVVDVGSGAGTDSIIAALAVGPEGAVVGVDMTDSMLERARSGARAAGATNARFARGMAEDLPVPDDWADVIISNGVMNLVPDKVGALREMHRALKQGGRLQLADIYVERPVPEGARADIDLWTG
jgi:arsenite methyltransferase